jgi:hypothetical protein
MATIKSYSDVQQSKKLAEILPLESADMAYYQWKDDSHLMSPVPFVLDGMEEKEDGVFEYIPCWSLAALLSILPTPDLVQNSEGTWLVRSWVDSYPWSVGGYSNPVDACVAMIEKLHKLSLL